MSFDGGKFSLTDPAVKAEAVTLSGVTAVSPPSRSLWVGSEGDIEVKFVGDSASVVLVGVGAGTILPIAVKEIIQSGTTADNIVVLR